MLDYFKTIVRGQFEASLCMLNLCLEKCPGEFWKGKIANSTFQQVAYHTLFFADYYLSSSEEAFELRPLHERGGDERLDAVSPGLSQEDTLAYLVICRAKLVVTLDSETAESLAGPSGFSRLSFSRGELYLYNLRHVQHHTGQLSAYLRRIVHDGQSWWVKTGWR